MIPGPNRPSFIQDNQSSIPPGGYKCNGQVVSLAPDHL